MFLLTYGAYVCYYVSRKPLSVVKSTLIDCSGRNDSVADGNDTETSACRSYIGEKFMLNL